MLNDQALNFVWLFALIVGVIRVFVQLLGKSKARRSEMIAYAVMGVLDVVILVTDTLLYQSYPWAYQAALVPFFFVLAGIEWYQLRKQNEE